MKMKLISAILILMLTVSSFSAFAANVNLTDIDESHWAYASIAELVSNGTVNGYPDGSFKPNGTVTYAEFEKMITGEWKDNPTPINREAALEMLWQHSGSPAGYSVPSAIYNQMENKDSVSWGYATGLMQGNDGFNLRPLDTLSRAEAATLIVRSRKNIEGDFSFASSVSDAIAKEVWEVYNIFGSAYVAEETVTPEELSAAAIKLGKFKNNSLTATDATIEDCATLLSYAAIARSGISVAVSNTDTATNKYGLLPQVYTAYGYEKGIVLPGVADKLATKRDIAILLIQLDELLGKDNFKINKNVASYPANNEDFAYFEFGIPMMAYTTSFDNGAKPVDFYKFVSNYTFIFENFINDMESNYGKDKVDFTLIPSLISQNDKTEAILRVKCTLTGATAYELFGAGYENAGDVFYMDIHTGEPVLNIYIPTEIAKIGKFVCNQ